MSAEQATENLYRIPILGIECSTQTFNFYANTAILLYGFFTILYLIKKSNRNLKDEENYDWSKYNITSDKKISVKKSDLKEKVKIRQKPLSKGTGFIRDEHKFPTSVIQQPTSHMEIKKERFLNIEEADNLQDMINYAASISAIKKDSKANKDVSNDFPLESLYNQILNANANGQFTNEKLDSSISEILKTDLDPNTKIKNIMELYKQLVKLKSKVLSESTYTGLVELFMSNGYLEHASYFLCQMDRQKMKIPRNLLDLFLEYSVKNKVFETADTQDLNSIPNYEPKVKSETLNKFDQYEPQNDPDYVYYFSKRNLYKKRKDMNNLISGLKIDAKPFFPKSVDNNVEKMKSKLSEIDTTKIKEFIPKSYKIEKKN